MLLSTAARVKQSIRLFTRTPMTTTINNAAPWSSVRMSSSESGDESENKKEPVSESSGSAVRARMMSLRSYITDCNQAYYIGANETVKGATLPSDAEYDAILWELSHLESEWPALAKELDTDPDAPRSPTSTVGHLTSSKMQHLSPMLSLQNTYDVDVIAKWAEKIIQGQGPLCVEHKYDGIALAVRYKRRQGANSGDEWVIDTTMTRGNGLYGENATSILLNQAFVMIAGLPLSLNLPGVPASASAFEVRGELVMSTEEANRVGGTGSMGRNIIAGLVSRKSLPGPAETTGDDGADDESSPTQLLFRAYSALLGLENGSVLGDGSERHQDEGAVPEWVSHLTDGTHSEVLDDLAVLGFEPCPHRKVLEDVESVREVCRDSGRTEDYDTDGLVFKVNARGKWGSLGVSSRAPKWSMAFKWAPKAAPSILESVSWTVGRSGRLAPIAHVTPITVGGAVVSKATLHNAAYAIGTGLRIGGQVIVERRGDVIPAIKAPGVAATEQEQLDFRGMEGAVSLPSVCPCGAGSPIVPGPYDPDTSPLGPVHYLCGAGVSCRPRQEAAWTHFFGRQGGLSLNGIGPSVATTLAAVPGVQTPLDLWPPFTSTPDLVAHLTSLPGWKEKRATKVSKALTSGVGALSGPAGRGRVLSALGLPGVGARLARVLGDKVTSLRQLPELEAEALAEIPGVSDDGAQRLVGVFQSHVHDSPLVKSSEKSGEEDEALLLLDVIGAKLDGIVKS